MRQKLTQKQEQFALNIFQGMTQREAWKQAGYSVNYPIAHIDRDASLLASSPKISQRLAELREEVKSAAIMNVQERMEALSEIARANMTNFVEVGQDGAWFNIDNSNLNSRAIQSVQSKTVLGKDGADDAVFIRVNLHDPMKAIDLLNKMEGIYSEGSTVNIDNRIIEIHDPKGKLVSAINRLAARGTEIKASTEP